MHGGLIVLLKGLSVPMPLFEWMDVVLTLAAVLGGQQGVINAHYHNLP